MTKKPKPTEKDGGLDAEAFAWWRSFVKPIHSEMVKKGIRRMTIEIRPDGRTKFELSPDSK